MTTYPLITSTPEALVLNAFKIPVWAHGSTAIEREGYGYECYELRRDNETVGWMYDDGAGYLFSEGLHGEPDRAVDA